MANTSTARTKALLVVASFVPAVLGLLCLPSRNASAAPAASLSVPPDAFLNYHVGSLGALSREITLDPMVRARLARHFHTSGPAIAAYVKNNLVMKKLTSAGRYKVYCVSRSGREYFVMQHLAVGTPLFVLRTNGKPILKLACGNPMVATLPKVAAARPIKPKLPHQVKLKPAIAEKVPPSMVAANGPTTVVADTLESGQVAFTSVPVVVAGHSGLPAWLAAIPLITGLVSIPHHDNSPPVSNTPPVVIITPPHSPPPAAVPEPSPAWVFAVGGLILGARLLKRRSSICPSGK